MTRSISVRFKAETCKTLAHGSIGAGYSAVGTALSHAARMIVIQNLTDASLYFSFDGVNDHIPLASTSYLVLDISANKTVESGFFMAEGDKLYVKQIGAPTAGNVYFTSFYGS